MGVEGSHGVGGRRRGVLKYVSNYNREFYRNRHSSVLCGFVVSNRMRRCKAEMRHIFTKTKALNVLITQCHSAANIPQSLMNE